jgi:formylmethanofuran dehydrogenase subunit E
MKGFSFIPEAEPAPRLGAPNAPSATCEQCGDELPEEHANDQFPLCWRCLEETLQGAITQ